jgi:electron transfer flavoprotein beta subunit
MVNIIVPVKQVPDIGSVRFDREKGRIDRTSASAEINPFDLNALEAAILIKDTYGGTIIAISMGPQSAEATLRDALSRGADRAILLTGADFAGADTLATSFTLACAIKKTCHFDLIICGEKTVDGDTGQVGPAVAEHLGIPHISYVSNISISGQKITVTSEMENIMHYESAFPLLITVTKDINKPRLPSLSAKLRARKADIEIWNAHHLSDSKERFGSKGSRTKVHRIVVPKGEERKGLILRNTPDEAATIIIQTLVEHKLLERR